MKIYKDSKDLPFLIYKKIMQTGDFLYMIKGYEDGEEIEADAEKLSVLKAQLEDKFNDLITDFAIATNGKSEEITAHSNYLIAMMEFGKLTTVLSVVELMIKAKSLLTECGVNEQHEIDLIISELLEGIKVPKNKDFDVLRKNIIDKLSVYESNILKYKELLEQNEVKNNDSENDLDKQFINICLILEVPFPDEEKLTLYQFSIMIERAFDKVKEIEKINSKS